LPDIQGRSGREAASPGMKHALAAT